MVTQRTMNTTRALNFILSAKAPVTSAGVMMANMAWNIMKAWWGTVSEYGPGSSAETPSKPNHDRSPMNPPMSGPNAIV